MGADHAGGVLRVELTSPPLGVRLFGEVDLENCAQVRSALVTQAAAGPTDVHVDVASLHFIDVAGLRTLVETALRMQPGRRLVLHSASEELCVLVKLAGWDRVPGLVLEKVTSG
ncbi:STAS domain-containing protein [Streptomyces sp. SID3343]|uniref:STAS domain-containing protein n=1 Tax=Streptomyces sp. SID3343 TaxID=2690260 RepID=UPI0013707FE4|nr:STAS domain-containing protein [Streptomyces sp. SID3343]MYW04852.1 STAS domain-containing protein [Streptomyces sp. SID3343]